MLSVPLSMLRPETAASRQMKGTEKRADEDGQRRRHVTPTPPKQKADFNVHYFSHPSHLTRSRI